MKYLNYLKPLLSMLLILFLMGCSSTETQVETTPIMPEKYTELKVTWQDCPEKGGLLLSYDEFRKLAFNIKNMREYEAKLEAVLIGESPLEKVEVH